MYGNYEDVCDYNSNTVENFATIPYDDGRTYYVNNSYVLNAAINNCNSNSAFNPQQKQNCADGANAAYSQFEYGRDQFYKRNYDQNNTNKECNQKYVADPRAAEICRAGVQRGVTDYAASQQNLAEYGSF